MEIGIDPFPSNGVMNRLWRAAWGAEEERDFGPVLSRSLVHVGAVAGGELIGFLNVAWDGGLHAFLLDTCVVPEFRRQGVARQLVEAARQTAAARGAAWLHVDFEPQLEPFYRACGFRPCAAGLIRLRS